MALDAVSLIKQDHRVLEELFQQVKAGKGDRYSLLEEIAALLGAHARAEEQEVYPVITKSAPGSRNEVEHSYHEHDEAEELLENALQSVDTAEFDAIFAEFVAAVAHHVEEEETQVLPALEKALDRATLVQLGDAFARARAQELDKNGFDDDDEQIAAYGRGHQDLAAATRDELTRRSSTSI
jgi:hemerythrin superfamily protein